MLRSSALGAEFDSWKSLPRRCSLDMTCSQLNPPVIQKSFFFYTSCFNVILPWGVPSCKDPLSRRIPQRKFGMNIMCPAILPTCEATEFTMSRIVGDMFIVRSVSWIAEMWSFLGLNVFLIILFDVWWVGNKCVRPWRLVYWWMRNINVCEPSENDFHYREWWFHTVSFGCMSFIAHTSFNRNSCKDPIREVEVVVVWYAGRWCMNHSIPCNIGCGLTHIHYILAISMIARRIDCFLINVNVNLFVNVSVSHS
jgi:hypothetical protein